MQYFILDWFPLGGRWDHNQEEEILEKIENLDNLTMFERGQIVNYIIFKYMRQRSIKFNLRSYDEVYKTLQNIIEDPEFRNFTFNQYHVFIYQDKTEKSVRICQVRNEILSFIFSSGNLNDDELIIKVKQMLRKSKFFQGKLAEYLNRDKRMDKA
jgi:hypothetical protein